MPYVVPTVSLFKMRFPEFTIVCDELVEFNLNDAINEVGDCWDEDDRALAQLMLAAHYLAVQGEPNRSSSLSNGETAANPQATEISSVKIGDISVNYGSRSSSAPSSLGYGAGAIDYFRTPYGQRYYKLLGRNVTSIQTV